MKTRPDKALVARPAPPSSTRSTTQPLKDLPRFRRALLGWYDDHRRDLPWRKTRDPYPIWLSEIMLQQTRVAAVLEHYRVFLERFRDVAALAAASEDAVLAAWSGLGYYRRARMMHQCARQIIDQHGGEFPRNSETLLELPGIGRYTAAAIASIAFTEPIAVVDGNVERVLRRLTGTNLTAQQTWQHAQMLLEESRPGDFNQAMMELGATVCVPRGPLCSACPLRKWCATKGEIAHAKTNARQRKEQIWCFLEGRDLKNGGGKIRLVRRSKKIPLMAGMWELPQSSEPPNPLPPEAHWRTFRHSITVTDYTVHVLRNVALRNASDAEAPSKCRWIATNRISQLPITGLTRKILRASGII
jgi:A/G-specific adenine glycosylase